MRLTRRDMIGTVFSGGVVLMLGGCGGGGNSGSSNTETVSTGARGRLTDGFLSPRPGQAFISRSTVFQAFWDRSAPPPSQFTAQLNRYREPIGGEQREITTQKISIDRDNSDTYRWNIARRDGYQLDSSGVYFLTLGGSDNNSFEEFAYIVDPSRAVTRGETINPGTNGFLTDVQISPYQGSCFIPKSTDFTISWSRSTPPPSQVTMELHRYKEQRGTENQADYEQKVEVFQNSGSDYSWTLRRKDNYDMDGSGVYYIALFAPGQSPYYAVYIIQEG